MEGKKRFKVKWYKDTDGKVKKAVFIDNEIIDYSVDLESLKKISSLGEEYKRIALKDIEKHFMECLSDTVGRKITENELRQAIETGWI